MKIEAVFQVLSHTVAANRGDNTVAVRGPGLACDLT